jgi:hypothetical protein
MNNFVFVAKQKNTASVGDFSELKFINMDSKYFPFTIFNQTQSMPHPNQSTLRMNDSSYELIQGGNLEYDLIMKETLIGKKIKVEREHLKQFYLEQMFGRDIASKPIKNAYQIREGLACGGTFIIYEDMTALLLEHGSGMLYVTVYRGFIKSQ